MSLNIINKSKRRSNATTMSTIKIIKIVEISYSDKMQNNSINILIIVNRNFNNNCFKINFVIKTMFIKIINFHNNLVKNINNLIINKTISNKSLRYIKSTITTTTIKIINTQTLASYYQHQIDCRLSLIQQTTTRQIRINNHNNNFLNQRAIINFEIISTIIRRVFNQRIKQTFSKKSTKMLLYKQSTNLIMHINLRTI